MSTAENTLLESRFTTQEVSPVTTIEKTAQDQSLRACVETTMENYFRNLDGQAVSDIYTMVLAEIEAPLLEVVMKNTRQNQTKASEILGLNRGTLRKKLKQYGLL
ncbi:MAG: Fis family transcriptional regulator [Kiritimatiellia bacterium]|jgi:Fis family transcriptional regulator